MLSLKDWFNPDRVKLQVFVHNAEDVMVTHCRDLDRYSVTLARKDVERLTEALNGWLQRRREEDVK